MARKVRGTPPERGSEQPDLAPFSSRSLSIRNWLLLGRFEPARAQRDYQWIEPQWKDLLSDLLNVFRYAGLDPLPIEDDQISDDTARPDNGEPIERGKKPIRVLSALKVSHFYLGHVILFRQRQGEGFFIYDGQQRLTTLTLLLCALRDAPEGRDSWQSIQEILRTSEKEARLTLPAVRGANPLVQILSALNGTDLPARNQGMSPVAQRIFEAAQYFKNETESWSAERLKAFSSFLLDNVFVTVTFLVDRRVAEYAYITTNTRGKSLENSDIIKGHFTQLASLTSPAMANQIAESWSRLEKSASRRLERFLRVAYLLDFRCAPNFDFGAQLMDHFADHGSLDDARQWLEERLPELLAIEKKLVQDPLRQDKLTGHLASIRRLGFLPWRHWQAVLFRLLERDKNAPRRFEQSIQALERWCFGVNLLGWDEQTIVSVIIRALDQIDRNVDPFAPRNRLALSSAHKDTIRKRLREGQLRNDETRGAHVRWLETLYWPQDGVNFEATQNSSVEHILPRRPDGQWSVDFPERPAYYTECLGNLCLIPKELNGSIGNSQYKLKRPQLRALPPYFKSAREVAQATRWDSKAIEERNARLGNLAGIALELIEA